MINTKKIGSVLKNLQISEDLELYDEIKAQEGQLIAVKVISVNPNYNKLELISGRITELTEGDIILGALGNRIASSGMTGMVPEELNKHDKIDKVIYPSLMNGVHGDRANKYLKGGFGSLLGFELKEGESAGKKFIDNLKLLYHVANIGDARSLAIHPASTTHSQLSPEEQLSSGVTPGYVRLSIGIEHIDDIIEDLDQALSKT